MGCHKRADKSPLRTHRPALFVAVCNNVGKKNKLRVRCGGTLPQQFVADSDKLTAPGFASKFAQDIHAFQNTCIANQQMRHLGDLNPCGQSPMDFESISLAARTKCLATGATALALAPPRSLSEKNACQKTHHKEGATLFAPKHMTRTVGFPLPVVEAPGVATVSIARLARSCGCLCFPQGREFEPPWVPARPATSTCTPEPSADGHLACLKYFY